MAIVKRCNRCGKTYNHYQHDNYNAIKRVKTDATNTFIFCSSTPIDLCEECMHEFDKFMDIKEINSTKQTVIFNGIKYDRLSKEEKRC